MAKYSSKRHCVTWWCDVHHLLAWIDGGQTDLDNAALLCERHHTKVHHGFRVERRPDGRWRTWRPDGTEDRKSTRLNSSHANISYAVFCLKKTNPTSSHAVSSF